MDHHFHHQGSCIFFIIQEIQILVHAKLKLEVPNIKGEHLNVAVIKIPNPS